MPCSFAARAFSPPLRGRCPRRGQRGVSTSRQTQPFRIRRTASPPSVSYADISPSRGEGGVRRAARLPFDTGRHRCRPGLEPEPPRRTLKARPRLKAGAAERMRRQGDGVSGKVWSHPGTVIPGSTGDPIHRPVHPESWKGHGTAAALAPKPQRSANEWIPGQAGDDPGGCYPPPYPKHREGHGWTSEPTLGWRDTGRHRRRPGLEPGPLRRASKARPRRKAGAARHMRRQGDGVSGKVWSHPGAVIPGSTGDPIHRPVHPESRKGHGTAAVPAPKPQRSANEWIPGQAGDDPGGCYPSPYPKHREGHGWRDTGRHRRRPGLEPGPPRRALKARPRRKAGAAERMRRQGDSVSGKVWSHPGAVIPGSTGDPIHRPVHPESRKGHGTAAAPAPKPQRSANEWIPGQAGDDPGGCYPPPYPKHREGHRWTSEPTLGWRDTGKHRRRPGLDPGPLRRASKARPRRKAGAAWEMNPGRERLPFATASRHMPPHGDRR
ncbi:hypothetical protein CLV41_101634 [Roseibium marinum]|uniref:Uncharacterized protein n=1 Tax=Roseibium marinum TaxID=281252 RepID=A0A2S3V2H6_9HYPH|nr:hypothetical protein CLV41_101634 [Roseibium marinum]